MERLWLLSLIAFQSTRRPQTPTPAGRTDSEPRAGKRSTCDARWNANSNARKKERKELRSVGHPSVPPQPPPPPPPAVCFPISMRADRTC